MPAVSSLKTAARLQVLDLAVHPPSKPLERMLHAWR
jgi:hypothetical protein